MNNKLKVEDLKKFLGEHFVYEVNMLYYSAVKLHNYDKANNQDGINMSLENFLLHGRNLLEFFYRPTDNNYARAIHFIDNMVWQNKIPSKTKNIKELEKRSNEEIVHLTFNRISGTPTEKHWDWRNCFSDLLSIAKIFLNELPEKYFDDKLEELKTNINNFQSRI